MNNFRDFGYPPLKQGLLFRGGELSQLSDEDRDLLFIAKNIKTIIDLRSPEECAEKADAAVPGVWNVNIPLLTIADMSETVQGQFPDVLASYRRAVSREKKPLWSKIFEVLLNSKDGAVFFHCTQGKDRTGLVAAIVLHALGVKEEAIFQDYLKTNENLSMPAEYQEYAKAMPEEISKLFRGLFLVDESFLAEAFAEIERQCGSLDGFLKECCSLDEEKLVILRTKYAG